MTDWDTEGLTEGLDELSRLARVELLDELAARGISVEEMRRAVAEDRLVLLPVEYELAGEPRYTRDQLAEQTGIRADMMAEVLAAVGLSIPKADVVAYTDQDADLASRLKSVLDIGMPPDVLIELSRVLGMGMARYAEAVGSLFVSGFLWPGDSEYEVATRYAAMAERMLPNIAALLHYAFTSHLLEVIRSDVITADERERGEVTGRAELTVGFADLVGFTWLGEQLDSEQLGTVAAHLGALAAEVLVPPCRLVKTIGDAVMLVSPDTKALVQTMLRLVDAADTDDQVLSELRGGVAVGPAVAKLGDYYGSAVNLASRVVAKAHPGTVLTTDEVRWALGDQELPGKGLRWNKVGSHRLKGFEGRHLLWRVRLAV